MHGRRFCMRWIIRGWPGHPRMAWVRDWPRTGQIPSQILLRGGREVEEEDLEDIELWAEDSGGREVEENEEEDGPGPPL